MTNSLLNKINKGAAISTIALASLLPLKSVNAQLPFFTGKRPPATYTIENRTLLSKNEPKFTDILLGKTFRKEIPAWAYLRKSYNSKKDFSDLFYGVGGIVNIKNRIYMLPTVEATGKDFSGLTFYSTLDLGRGFNVDLNPKFDENLKYNKMPFNLGKTYKGLTFGASSDVKDGKLRRLRDTDFRIAKIKRGNFIDIGVNFGKKRVRVAMQKAF